MTGGQRVPEFDPEPTGGDGEDRRHTSRGLKHDPRIINGRPADLQPLPAIDPVRWQGQPVPDQEWLVRDLVPLEAVTLLSGAGGEGKTILMLQLLVCAAIGLPFLGLETRKVNALGFLCEDPGKLLHRRLAGVLRHYGRDFADLENLTLIDRTDQPNWLMEWGAVWESGNETALWYRLERDVLDRGIQLLVVDSLYNVFCGSKLEERHAVEFMGMLGRLSRRMNGAVALTFHPSRAGIGDGSGEFGSVGWHNTCRSRLYFRTPRREDGSELDPEVRELVMRKANLGRRAEPIKLKWDDGAFRRIEQPTGILASIENRAAEHAFLAALDAVVAQGRTVSDAPTSPRYAPKILVEMPEASGHTERELKKAMSTLFAAKQIRVDAVGKMANRVDMLGIVRTTRPTPAAGNGGEE